MDRSAIQETHTHGDLPLSADLLQRLNTSGELPVTEIADLLGISQSSAYRYLNETELRFGQLRQLLRFCRSDGARVALVHAVISGTPLVVTPVNPNLDLNGDGEVDTKDALAGTSKLLTDLASLLNHVVDMQGKGVTGEAEQDEILGLLGQIMGRAHVVQQILELEVRSTRQRRKARAFTPGGAV